jgi:ubiquinone biosynthesis protein
LASLSTYGRLVAAGWTLVRADALMPREIEAELPPGARALSGFLRLFAGRAARAGRPGQRLAAAFEALGPAAIKLGQLLSTRADIFGTRFAEDLAGLKDRLPPFPQAEAKAEVSDALGRPVDEVFPRFGQPVAAASLAQAHDATLPDGRRVAVKVLRPGIERRVARDCEALRLAAHLVERWVPAAGRLEPEAFAATVIRSLELELDLRFEAAGASELREVMAKDAYMRAPAVVWEGVGKRVLTLEWAQGAPLSDPASLDAEGLDRKALADNLIRAFLAQALDHGVFHADLHEGNLFAAAPAQLTAVDFGIIGRLGPTERRVFAEILYGFLTRDYDRIAAVHFEAGYVPAHQDRAVFAQALRAVGEPVIGRPTGELSMGRLLTQLFETTARFEMRLRPELVLLQKTMVTVEGVARRIHPDHDIWAAADPVVRRWIARELGPAAKARDLIGDATRALQALARMAEAPPTRAVVIEPGKTPSRLTWFATGVAVTVLATIVAGLFLIQGMPH